MRTALSRSAALATALLLSTTWSRPASAAGLGQSGDVAFSADRLMGVYFLHEGGDFTSIGVGAPAAWHPYTNARLAVDGFVIDHLSVGGSLAVWSLDTGGRRNGTGFLLYPRVGYAIEFSDSFGFWPRGGLTYRHFENDGELALTLEAQFYASPVHNFAFVFGPAFDLGMVGDGPHANSIGVLTAGLLGWI